MFVFGTYRRLFDVHAAIARFRAAAGPDDARASDTIAEVSVGLRGIRTNRGKMADEYFDFPPAKTLDNLSSLQS